MVGLAAGVAAIPTVNMVVSTLTVSGALVGVQKQTKELCDMNMKKEVGYKN